MRHILEVIGDGLIIALGIILVFIFVQVEVLGYYGMEQNALIRRVEMWGGLPVIIFGIYHLVQDFRHG